jgi:nucleoside-diphosphate-sugar epimerase
MDDTAGKGTPKGDKRTSDKGKAHAKPGDAGREKPQLKQIGEAEANAGEGRELRQQSSNPKEPETEPQKAFDAPENVLDISLAKSELSWSPRTELSEGLRATIVWNEERVRSSGL